MYLEKKISEDIYYVGVNDRQTKLFEGLWELPAGVSYNSYLIKDDKTCLIDTVDALFAEQFTGRVAETLGGRKLDYLVVNHMEPDHSASIKAVRAMWPDVTIVGNAKTFAMLKGYFGITDNLLEVKDGSVLPLGRHDLSFYLTPMVHWIETMMTYDNSSRTLFSGDAFGCFGALDGHFIDTSFDTRKYIPEMVRYYSTIVGKYGVPVQKAFQKLSSLQISTVCSTHGPVWRERVSDVLALYNHLSLYDGKPGCVIVYGSMHGNTVRLAETIADSLAAEGVRNIIVHDLSASSKARILADIFSYKGLVLGCPTYSNELFPPMAELIEMLRLRDVKPRFYACFGTCSWAGASAKKLAAFGEAMGYETVYPPVGQMHAISEESFRQCVELGKAMAAKLVVSD